MEEKLRIYITGASCAGVTTLGHTLAPLLSVRHVDVDDFYWLPTSPPFTAKRPANERVCLIQQKLGDGDWVLTGSFDGWGDALISNVDLIVFVATVTPVRLERLAAREKERFGDRIAPGGDMHGIHVAFREWASQYDNPTFAGRNRARHEVWISEQTVPVVRIDGMSSAEKMAVDVIHAVSQVSQQFELETAQARRFSVFL
jgi:adenylate kinase family enzyme